MRSFFLLSLLVPAAALAGTGPGPGPAAARPEAASAGVSAVIPAGNESFFQGVAKAPGVPRGWALDGIALDRTTATFTWKSGATLGRVVLSHPSAAPADAGRTARFAVAPGDPPAPKEIVRAVLARVKKLEGTFQWQVEVRDAPRRWTPTLPADALAVDRMPRPRFDLQAPDAEEAFRRGQALARDGKGEEARTVAADLATRFHAPRAAAAVLRRAGDGAGAAALLAKVAGAGIERAASLLLDGRVDEARAAAGPGEACGFADAVVTALRDGPAGAAAKARTWIPAEPKQPRCLHLARLKTLCAAGDGDALDAAGRASLAELGDDEDLLYLWGDCHYQKQQLTRTLSPWDRLARKNPRYPGVLGLYGTAAVLSGRLDRKGSDELAARAIADPNDVVSAFLAGIGMHYLRDYAPSIPLLERAMRMVPDEPRGGMYLAMAYYFTGDQARAEKILEDLEPYAYHEPDVYYCRSLVWRVHDLPRAVREMETFLEIMKETERFVFNPLKMDKARTDLEKMRRGEIPDPHLPDSPTK